MKLQKLIAFLMTTAMVLGMMPALTLTAVAAGTDYTVSNLNDSGPGSLREAIDSAASGGTIVFQSGLAGTIVLSSQLTISKNLTITGPGASNLTVSGNNTCRVLAIAGGNVTISGLTIADGRAVGNSGTYGEDGHGGGGGGGGGAAGGGGGILIKSSGMVIITNVNFTNNAAVGGSGGSGGAGWQTSGGGIGGIGGISDLYDPPYTAAGGYYDANAIYPGADGLHYSGAGGGYGGSQTGNGGLGGSGQNNGGDGGPGGNTGDDHSGYEGYGGDGGTGGSGEGGAICQVNGCMYVSSCSFTGNQAVGGTGGNGGDSNFTLISGNDGLNFDGSDGAGGSGKGGAIYIGESLGAYCPVNDRLVNNTFSGNSVAGGTGLVPGISKAADVYEKSLNGVSVRNLTGDNYGMFYEMSAPDAQESIFRASTYETTANGVSVVTLTVSLCDAGRVPIFGEMVTLNQGGGHSVISPLSAVTNTDGQAFFTVTNTVAETVTYSAVTAGGVTVAETATIKFNTGGVSAAKSTVIANPTVVTADGSAFSTITVSLKDSTGNTVGSGRTIKLTAGGGSSVITPSSAVTDDGGTVTFTVKDSMAETVTYTAKDVTDGVTLGLTATVNFTQYNWIVTTLDDSNTPGTLRYTVANATANTTITFDSSLSGGTITLTSPLPAINKNLIIDGSALNLTVSGGNLCRVFEVDGGTVAIQNLNIINGRSAGATGAAGTYNATTGAGGNGQSGAGGSGGALLITGGTVTVTGVTFSGNSASGGSGGRGADSMDSGLSNSGWAGIGGAGGDGHGGAVCLTGGTLTVSNSTFTGNGTSGGGGANGGNGKDLDGAGGNGGSGLGGAIYAGAGSITISNTIFSDNSASGGKGGDCGNGTSAYHSSFGSSGNAGKGGDGSGGAVYITGCTLTITDSQLNGNVLTAGGKGAGTSYAYNNSGMTAHCDGTAGVALGSDICSIGGTVTSNNVTLSPGENSFYNSSASDAGLSTVTTAPSSVISDGAATATITVTLKGSGGSSIGSGKTVTLSQGGGHSTITPSSAVTDNAGTVTFTVKSFRAETVTYTATNATDGITVAQTAVVEFLPPDDSQSAIEASSDSITADNTEVSTITVTLKYLNGDPAAGKTISLDQGTGHSSITPASTVTDSDGQAVFTVKSAVAETVTYRAKITPDNVTMAESASVTFNAYGWVVSTKEDTGDPGSLRYAITNAPDGEMITFSGGLAGETLTLTGTLPAINKNLTIDGLDLGVTISGDGQYRIFDITGGTVTIKNLTVANGKAVGANGANGTYADGSGGAKGMGSGLYMTNGTVTLSGVTFKDNSVTGGNGGNGAVDSVGNGATGGNGCGGAIYLAAGSLSVENSVFTNNTAAGGNGGNGGTWNGGANGGNGGNGGSGCGGAIYVNSGSLTLSDSTFNGNTVNYGFGGGYGAWGKQAGSNGSIVGCDIFNPGGTVTIADNVTLTPGTNSYINYSYAPEAALSTVTADDTSVMSGNGVCATITVTLIGPGGSSVGSGKTVTLTPNSGNSSITPASSVTDGYGRVTFTVTNPYVQNVTYTAKDTSDNVTLSQTVTISFMPPDAAQSAVTVDSAQISSDNVTYATVSVTLKGADGSPAGSGKTVTLSPSGGSSTITPEDGGLTGPTGIARFRVRNLASETVTYTARDTTDNVTVSGAISVQFLPPDKDASAAITDKSSVKADGTTVATISVTLKSAAGIPFGSGKTVTLTPDGGNSKITAKDTGVTNGSGTATFYVSNLASESVTYTAKDTTDGVTLTQTVTVTFIDNDWIVTKLDDTDTLGSLRYAVKNAPAGSTIGFDDSIKNGIIVLSSPLPVITKNLTFDGGGTAVTVSGGDTFRVFEVSSATVTFRNLTIANGWNAGNAGADNHSGNGGTGTAGSGGGLLVTEGTVVIDQVTFRDNNVLGGKGGTCVFMGGSQRTGGTGGKGCGGAIYLNSGTLSISSSIFIGNSAIGGVGGLSNPGNGGAGGSGFGGSIYINSGALTMSASQFSGDSVVGGAGGPAYDTYYHQGPTGDALAADLYNVNGTITLSDVTFGALTNSYCTMTPASASASTVSGSVPNLPADGTTALIVTVTLNGADGKPAGSGKRVSLTAGSGSPVIKSASNGLTDNNGTVTFTVTYIKSETVTFTAKDDTDNVPIGQVSATFLPPDTAQSSISTKTASVPASGTDKATITVTIKFGNGVPAAGKTVTLTAGSGSSAITAVDGGVTNSDGEATFMVTNLTAEKVTYTATDTSDQMTIGSVEVTFTDYAWVVTSLEDNGNLGTLRYALTKAPSGSTITFQSSLTGTITLNSTLPAIARNLTIDGSGANVTVSGNMQHRAFQIDSGTVSLMNFTIADCQLVGSVGPNYNWDYSAGGTGGYLEGGALFVDNATVSLSHVTFRNNSVTGGQSGTAGAVKPGGVGGYGYGGAVYFKYGTLTISYCTFSDNSALGGSGGEGQNGGSGGEGQNGGSGGEGFGGAILAFSGNITISDTVFSGNAVTGGAGGAGIGGSAEGGPGYARGSDIYCKYSKITMNNVTFNPGSNCFYNAEPADHYYSEIATDQPAAPADGTTPVTITVSLKVINGTSAGSGKAVTLTADKTGVVITPVNGGVTDGYGKATFTVTGSSIETVTFTAKDTTDNFTLLSKVQVRFDPYFTVTLDRLDGTPAEHIHVATGAKIPAAVPVRAHYTFGGWFTDEACGNEWDTANGTVTADVTLYVKWTANVYTVTFDSQGGSTVSSATAAYNTAISAPIDPTRSGYSFGGWYKELDCTNPWSFANGKVTGDTTLYAKWTQAAGPGGGGSGGGNSTGETPKIEVTTSNGMTTATVTATASAGPNGTASASVTQSQIEDAANDARKEAASQGTKAEIEIAVSTNSSTTGLSVTIPQSALDSIADSGIDTLTISSPAVTVSFDETALTAISDAGSGSITISAVTVDQSSLSAEYSRLVGDRPVYDLTVASGNTTISDFGGGTATVSIPYEPGPNEDISKIVIYYISGSGALIMVPSCMYDPSTGMVTFATTHFSTYAVGYNNVSFTDVSGWYADSVYYLAARNVMSGPGGGLFNPGGSITRAELAQLLYNLSGSSAVVSRTAPFDDVKSTDWYFDAVKWAYDAGIITGIDGKFDPNAPVKRQDIAVMLVRYVENVTKHTLPLTGHVSAFHDSAEISQYALNAVTAMQRAGIISGNSDGSFKPQANAARAEAAKMIAALMKAM